MALDPQVLKKVDLFAGLDDKEAAKIAPLFKERNYSSGDVIAEEGKHGVGFFIIESGEAKVTSHGEDRRTLGPRTATVTAASDVKAHVLVAWDFRPIVQEDPDLAWGLLQGVAGLLRVREGY
jgi:CRP-like cAMP-binding protein